MGQRSQSSSSPISMGRESHGWKPLLEAAGLIPEREAPGWEALAAGSKPGCELAGGMSGTVGSIIPAIPGGMGMVGMLATRGLARAADVPMPIIARNCAA